MGASTARGTLFCAHHTAMVLSGCSASICLSDPEFEATLVLPKQEKQQIIYNIHTYTYYHINIYIYDKKCKSEKMLLKSGD